MYFFKSSKEINETEIKVLTCNNKLFCDLIFPKKTRRKNNKPFLFSPLPVEFFDSIRSFYLKCMSMDSVKIKWIKFNLLIMSRYIY